MPDRNHRPVHHQALTPEALTMVDAIVRTTSFAATRELGKVPSALTCSVRQLEESLDALLFDRSSRQVLITEAGRLVLKSTVRSSPTAQLHYAWRAERSAPGLGRALQWWLKQLESPAKRRSLIERHVYRL
jgi:DNA-binding transcriptional LysR family regulator